MNPSDWLLLPLIAALPAMKPDVRYPIMVPDVVFVLLAAAVGIELLSGRRRLRWTAAHWVLLAYAVSLAPSLIVTPNLRASLISLVENLYLVTLAGLTASLIDTESKLRRAILTWLAATGVMVILAPLSVAAFYLSIGSSLLNYTSYDFGSLPPGDYPRLSLTFIYANMACNYLTVSLGLLLAARQCSWLGARPFWLLLAAIVFAAITTLSPGLGGVALILGLWVWLLTRNRSTPIALLALCFGAGAAALFIVALAVTPVVYPTAPFLIHLPGTTIVLAPSGRFLTWSSAAAEFASHPLIGHGIGIEPARVLYPRPDRFVEHLTDAHNVFLSIAAQAGIVGLAGLAAIIALATLLTGKLRLDGSCMKALMLALGLSFLNGFVYQGIGGSFEHGRHLWVLLGMLIAGSSLTRDVSRPDGSSRTPAAPSPG